jgi:hypothetical protein
MPQAKITGQIIKVDGPAGEEVVLVQMDIDCPVCGTYAIIVQGHHLGSLRDLILEAMDMYPELTRSGPRTPREDFTFSGRPNDPKAN